MSKSKIDKDFWEAKGRKTNLIHPYPKFGIWCISLRYITMAMLLLKVKLKSREEMSE